jgi:hypothetical protein
MFNWKISKTYLQIFHEKFISLTNNKKYGTGVKFWGYIWQIQQSVQMCSIRNYAQILNYSPGNLTIKTEASEQKLVSYFLLLNYSNLICITPLRSLRLQKLIT